MEKANVETLRTRGFDIDAYIEAARLKDLAKITLTHPSNWMTEAEVEDGQIPDVLKEIADNLAMIRSNIGSYLSGGKFGPGMIVATPGALALAEEGVDLLGYLKRHLAGDWGDLDPEDIKENNRSLKEGYRLLSSYENDKGKVWIITEADRSATTILLPSEY